MPSSDNLCLRLAIARLTTAAPEHYAIWVVDSPHPGGYVHHDCVWSVALTQAWESWQEMFSLRGLPDVPHVPSVYVPSFVLESLADDEDSAGQPRSYSSRLMQHLGVNLWQWLFEGPIQRSLDQSLGIAMGQNKPLRLRLEIRDPDLIALPWEIMQQQAGQQALSLNQQRLFSRTTSDVDPLPEIELDASLRVLLVLGHDENIEANATAPQSERKPVLQLQEEAIALKNLLERGTSGIRSVPVGKAAPVVCQVDTLLQPDSGALVKALDSGIYNVFFYAGHGVPAPDGGLLFLQADATLNGTELAQVLTRCHVKLAVFNTCWGAQPDQSVQQTIPRSSLAEVLLHHGVPAVVAMRDSIADEEALSFIQVFTQSLMDRLPVDQAVAIARQHLLTLYKFNQPAWTLPVLYMHPQFDGELLHPVREDITRLPSDTNLDLNHRPQALLRAMDGPEDVWPIYGGLMRVGRLADNDLVIPEPWVSSKHAEIFSRRAVATTNGQRQTKNTTYFLRDFSRNGTFYRSDQGWRQVQRQEIPLLSGTQLRFGSSKGRLLEFVLEGSPPPSSDLGYLT
ncbi:MAG: CHAT domain-containing protein [Leptolyngbyaceae cyanobacterium SM1_1_3]|nr:CHAT domain-containing protein [Leptolyngbyaceae cyanobacterium SM1_1_3]NJN01785.1 CHAT domain-containing protein [Leptolyngbyaceae cyanobacterium RM1_1_2]